jgi:hypothetical protein
LIQRSGNDHDCTIVTDQVPPWRDVAAALGPPIYGVPATEPNESYGASFVSGSDTQPESINLGFGEWGEMLVVGTSTESVDDGRIVVELLLNAEPRYPLTIEDRTAQIAVEHHLIDFRIFWITDRSWSAIARVEDRWVHLRGIGAALDDVVVETIL